MDTMLSKALREFMNGPLNQLVVNIGGQNGRRWEEEFKKFLRQEPCWSPCQVELPASFQKLLKPISQAVILAHGSPFVAKNVFVENIQSDAALKICRISTNFATWFLSGEGKTEPSLGDTTLGYADLKKPSEDMPIIKELGGEDKVETTLQEMFFLMKKQNSGKRGPLRNKCCGNIFYIRDLSGTLRTVGLYRAHLGWHVDSDVLDFPEQWADGYRVFWRMSEEPSGSVTAKNS